MSLARLSLALACGLLIATATQADEPAVKPADATFVVKPYLQIGRDKSPDSLRVLWHADDSDAAWEVESRARGTDSWRKAEVDPARRVAVADVAPHRIYSATFRNLEPGAAFEYRVLKGGQPVFSSTATARKSPSQSYRFVAFGDCGAGSSEQKPLALRASPLE